MTFSPSNLPRETIVGISRTVSSGKLRTSTLLNDLQFYLPLPPLAAVRYADHHVHIIPSASLLRASQIHKQPDWSWWPRLDSASVIRHSWSRGCACTRAYSRARLTPHTSVVLPRTSQPARVGMPDCAYAF